MYEFCTFSGISDIRVSSTNKALPNPRDISVLIRNASGVLQGEVDGLSDTNNLYTFAIGQYLDHDYTLSPAFTCKFTCMNLIVHIHVAVDNMHRTRSCKPPGVA